MLNHLRVVLYAILFTASLGVTSAFAANTISSINPNVGQAANAGEVIEIIGGAGTTFTNLGGGNAAARVYFGTVGVLANRGTAFTLLDDTHIQVAIPSETKGTYTVTVTDVADGNGVALANGFTFTAANRTLQVSVKVNIAKNASIAWGVATDNDDNITTPKGSATTHAAGTVAPYLWFVRDSQFGAVGTNAQADFGATYSTDGGGLIFAADTDNGHTHTLQVASTTGSLVEIDGISSDSSPASGSIFWTNAGGAAAADKYEMQAAVGTAFAITNESIAAGSATITTALPHGLQAGNKVTITNTVAANIAAYDGTFTIATVPTTTSFTYADANAAVAFAGTPVASTGLVVMNSNITTEALNANVATITTSTSHGFNVGDHVAVKTTGGGNPAVFDGVNLTITAVTANTFSYAKVNANIAATAATGTATTTNPAAVASAILKNTQAPVVQLYKGAIGNLALKLAVSTPTSTADIALVQQTITVTLVATGQ